MRPQRLEQLDSGPAADQELPADPLGWIGEDLALWRIAEQRERFGLPRARVRDETEMVKTELARRVGRYVRIS